MQIILLYMVALCVAFCHCDQSVAKPLSDQRVVNKLVSNLFDMLTRDSQASSGTNMFGLSENNFQSLLAPEQLSAVDLDNLDKMTSFEYAPKSSSFDNMFNQPIEAPPAVQLTNSVDESALKTQDSAVDDIVRAIFGVNSESNLIAPEKFSASSQDTLSKLEPISNPSSSSSLENAFSQSVQVPTVVEPIGGQMAFDENVLKQDSLNDGGGYFGSLFGVSENGLKNVLASNELAGVDLDAFTAFQHVPKPSRLENAFSRIVDVPQAPPETITQFSSDSILDDPSLFAQDVQPSAAGGLFGNLFGLSENNLKNILASNELAGVDLDAFSAFQHVPKPSRLDKAFTQVVDAPVVVPKVELPSPVVQTWNQVHTIKEAAPAIQLHQPTLEPYREPTVELNKPVKTSKYYNGNELNQHVGGLCRDFFNNNTVNTCCSKRDDECYMIHYGTRCYCDIYCNRHHMENYNSNPYDCCPDAEQDFCSAKSATTTTPKPVYYPNYNYNNYQIPQKIPNKQRPIVVQYRPAPLYTATTPEPIYTTTTSAAAVSSSVYTTTSTTERPAPIFRPAFRPLPPTTNTISPTTTTSAPTTTLTYPATTPDPIFLNGLFCKKQGVLYPNGFTLSENCKKCYCLDGVFKCVPKPCMVNTTLLNEINSQPSTWQASNQSEFWGQTLEYGYLHKLGVKLPNADFRNEKAYYANETEQSYDFRWEHFVRQPTSVWNQGECGASWAFSTVDVLVDRASKHEGKMIKVSPSVQMLISCTNKFTSNNCEPVEIDAGWAYIESYLPRSQGLVDEICYPLESATAGISNRCAIFEPDPNRCTDNKPYNRPYFKSTRAYRVRANTADIMHEILKNGPVQMVFKVYSDFFIYKSGIYTPTPNAYIPDVPNPYHAVKVLGWGTLNGVDYWIAANSWGPNWGENGFFKIKRQEPKTEIGQHVFAAWGFYDR